MFNNPSPYESELEGFGAFADRHDAGCQLAERLGHLRDRDPVVLALPRGGVPVGYEVARALEAPLDLIMVRKIGVPRQPELAYGAIVDGEHPEMVINRDVADLVQLPKDVLEAARQRELEEIERRRRLYLTGRPSQKIAGRTAIVVDDGIATGATMRAALRAVRRAQPRRSVLAVPVAPQDTIASLRHEVDEVVCPLMPYAFGSIGDYYRDFRQVADRDLIELLNALARDREGRSPPNDT